MTQIRDSVELDFCDVLFRPKRTTLNSRSEADIIREYKFKYYPKTIKSCGIMAANMATTGTFEMNDVLQKYKAFTCLHKHYKETELRSYMATNYMDDDSEYNSFTFISTGLKDDKEKVFSYLESGTQIDKICIDIANGYIPKLIEFVREVRNKFPSSLIMVGNVVTGDMTQDLILNGADIVKVGIGPGSVCTTRKLTGVGRPQLSAILECADAAHGVGGLICADGGCTCAGDVAKAFGAGADFVMIGGMFAGTDESAGELITKCYKSNEILPSGYDEYDEPIFDEPRYKFEIKQFKQFYGMSSQLAQEKHWGGMAKYRASEGKVVEVPYKGSVENVIQEIQGGLRSTMSYIGAKRLKDIPKCTTFYRVSRQLNEVFGKS
jgi:GMP reductase|uniref:GMP reductase n=1 Tax=Myoviridae sp. ctWb16 TaxID=2827690 RepID=A0A8S5T067_9CAUD|nr:MAG TPA: guanosine 5'-monophosphate oxidoreductase [Myoviridae sp. ctWb16]